MEKHNIVIKELANVEWFFKHHNSLWLNGGSDSNLLIDFMWCDIMLLSVICTFSLMFTFVCGICLITFSLTYFAYRFVNKIDNNIQDAYKQKELKNNN